MRKRGFQYVMYTILTIVLLVALLTFKTLRWVYGYHVDSLEKPWLWETRTLEISMDVISTIFALFTFIKKGRKKILDRDNIMIIFFILLFTGNLLYPGLDIKAVGIVFYFLAFCAVPFFWKVSIVEIIVRVVLLVGTPFLSYLTNGNHFSFLHIMSVELAQLVFVNLVFAIINYIKKKDLYSLFLFVCILLAFFTNAFICLRSVVTFSKLLKNIFAILVWPFYVSELLFLNHLYRKY